MWPQQLEVMNSPPTQIYRLSEPSSLYFYILVSGVTSERKRLPVGKHCSFIYITNVSKDYTVGLTKEHEFIGASEDLMWVRTTVMYTSCIWQYVDLDDETNNILACGPHLYTVHVQYVCLGSNPFTMSCYVRQLWGMLQKTVSRFQTRLYFCIIVMMWSI